MVSFGVSGFAGKWNFFDFWKDGGIWQLKVVQNKKSFSKFQVMDKLIAATIVIGDRSYRIKLNPKDEEVVRRTVKVINDKIIEYKTQFAGKDMQDYIAMVLIWLATEQHSKGSADIQQETLTEKLSAIEKLLDSQGWVSIECSMVSC